MRCNNCDKKATIKDVDPFYTELPELYKDLNEDEKEEKEKGEWWCEECYQERLDDI